MRLDYFRHVLRLYAAVPYAFGIDDNRRPKLAGVEAARHISANFAAESALLDFQFQSFADFGRSFRSAGAFRVAVGPNIFADEYVVFESHCFGCGGVPRP